MDFAYHYTEEQERFRAEVSAWLDANVPSEPALATGGAAWERLRLELGEKGWLAPTLPVEQGGAGLTPDHAVVVLEELDRRGLLSVHDAAGAQLRSALLESGSESLRRELVPVLASGRAVVWRIVLDDARRSGRRHAGRGRVARRRRVHPGRGGRVRWRWRDSDAPVDACGFRARRGDTGAGGSGRAERVRRVDAAHARGRLAAPGHVRGRVGAAHVHAGRRGRRLAGRARRRA